MSPATQTLYDSLNLCSSQTLTCCAFRCFCIASAVHPSPTVDLCNAAWLEDSARWRPAHLRDLQGVAEHGHLAIVPASLLACCGTGLSWWAHRRDIGTSGENIAAFSSTSHLHASEPTLL
eukprot:39840-Amphidinium_carterae.2